MLAANSISARREAPSSVADSIRRGALRCGGWVGGEVLGLCGGTVFGISLAGWRCWRLTCPRLDRIWGLMKRLVLLTLERVYVNTAITAMFILQGRPLCRLQEVIFIAAMHQTAQADGQLSRPDLRIPCIRVLALACFAHPSGPSSRSPTARPGCGNATRRHHPVPNANSS